MPNALISVSNKSDIFQLSNYLLYNNFNLYCSDGTYDFLVTYFSSTNKNYINKINKISRLTNFPEILNGRVKTLHPKIYGGILADLDDNNHINDINHHNIDLFKVIVVNLYPFEDKNCVENIDIGGVSLLRAGSKNYKNISVLSNPNQYSNFINMYNSLYNSVISNNNFINYNKKLASIAFNYISDYDRLIYNFLKTDDENNKNETINPNQNNIINLKYGMNPHQKPSALEFNNKYSNSAFNVINGEMGYINVLDIIHGWLMAKEIYDTTGYETCISMKHTSPAGLGVSNTFNEKILYTYDNIDSKELSNICKAYIKCRNCDPLSSFGDFICFSSEVDLQTAKLIKREVCDGILAPSFSVEALEILQTKKNGKFIIVKMNIDYYNKIKEDGWNETRELYGIKIQQPYNNFVCTKDIFTTTDSIISYIILKYSQSNNVSMVYDGQLLGLGCGQQNRVSCVKLCGEKANIWRLRHDKRVINYYNTLDKSLKRQEKTNMVYDYINSNYNNLLNDCQTVPITLGSDGFFPFTDNIIEASKYGVKNILQPGGSIMDSNVIEMCKKLNIEIINVGTRMFYH